MNEVLFFVGAKPSVLISQERVGLNAGALLGLVSHHSPLPLTAEWPLVVTHKEMGVYCKRELWKFWGCPSLFIYFFPILFLSLTSLLSNIFLYSHYAFYFGSRFYESAVEFFLGSDISDIIRWSSNNNILFFLCLWLLRYINLLYYQIFQTEADAFSMDANFFKTVLEKSCIFKKQCSQLLLYIRVPNFLIQ